MFWFNYENNLSVYMPDRVWQKITKLCNKHFPEECGGILIGNYDEALKTARINDTFISKGNKSSRYALIREAAEANKILRLMWMLSFKKKYFVGEWHSHPNGNSIPSSVDDESLFKIAQTQNCECSRPILIITNGNNDSGWKVDNVWLYTREGNRLELVAEHDNKSKE